MINILVVFTGGTIGSEASDGVRDVSAHFDALAARYGQRHEKRMARRGIAFYYRAPRLQTLSENMTVEKWNTLLEILRDEDLPGFAGVIITHGTDTLAYTAALLSVLLAHVPIPVVLVSANAPLTLPCSNGHKNFEDAVSFIESEHGKTCGVYAAYSYDLRRTVIYPAERIRQSQPFTNRFESMDGRGFGYVEDGRFFVENIAEAAAQTPPPLRGGALARRAALFRDIRLQNCVLVVQPYVGLDYSRIFTPEGMRGVRAVLHGLYHAGTCAAEEGMPAAYSAADFCQSCRAAARPVDFYCAPCAARGEPYGSTERMREAGARFIPNVTPELAYARLLVAYSHCEDAADIAEIVGETV